ncbi:MAG TPA: DUF4097 family beta strand repeat-containing protein [Thermoanaerobaculia bacterium]
MSHPAASTRSALACALALAAGLAAGASGAHAAEVATRTFHDSFPAGQPVRLANLVGRVDLVPAPAGPMTVDVTVHARGGDGAETSRLLAALRWIKARDRQGREELALSYPVGDYRGFCYPRPERGEHVPAFLSFMDSSQSSTTYLGERVRVYSRERSGVPILYADVKIGFPAGAALGLSNRVGLVSGGDLLGNLELGLGSSDVRIASLSGRLAADSGSGDLDLGKIRGETTITTGSGDVQIASLIGNGELGTGSGDVVIGRVAAGRLKVKTGSGDVTVRAGAAASVVADTGSGDVRLAKMDIEDLSADTRSGDVSVQTALDKARRVSIETASGDVRIAGGPGAGFDLEAHQGSGDLVVGYRDAVLRHERDKLVGARRGDGHTQIRIATRSGDCTITP